jgi:hypothetical protein
VKLGAWDVPGLPCRGGGDGGREKQIVHGALLLGGNWNRGTRAMGMTKSDCSGENPIWLTSSTGNGYEHATLPSLVGLLRWRSKLTAPRQVIQSISTYKQLSQSSNERFHL